MGMWLPEHFPDVEYRPDQLELASLYDGIDTAVKDPRHQRCLQTAYDVGFELQRTATLLSFIEATGVADDKHASEVRVEVSDPSMQTLRLCLSWDSFITVKSTLGRPSLGCALVRYVSLEKQLRPAGASYSLSKVPDCYDYLDSRPFADDKSINSTRNEALEDKHVADLSVVTLDDVALVRRLHAVLTRQTQ